MNVSSVLTKDYERNDIFAVPENKANSNPIKANTNPIKANKMPKQTQYKPNTNPISKAKKWRHPAKGCSSSEFPPALVFAKKLAIGRPTQVLWR